jgi:8-oxo-dGTP pyrophosphatase MutT (NUDIX family)
MSSNQIITPDQIGGYAASAAILNDAGEIALFLRDDVPLWTNIGGNLDPGEDFEMALHREAIEETGLKIKIVRFIGDFYSPMGNNQYRHEKVYFSRAKAPSILQQSDEGVAVRWFPIDQLPYNIGPRFRTRINAALSPAPSPVSVITHEPGMVDFCHGVHDFSQFVGLSEWLYHRNVVEKRQQGKLKFDPLPLLNSTRLKNDFSPT